MHAASCLASSALVASKAGAMGGAGNGRTAEHSAGTVGGREAGPGTSRVRPCRRSRCSVRGRSSPRLAISLRAAAMMKLARVRAWGLSALQGQQAHVQIHPKNGQTASAEGI